MYFFFFKIRGKSQGH